MLSYEWTCDEGDQVLIYLPGVIQPVEIAISVTLLSFCDVKCCIFVPLFILLK